MSLDLTQPTGAGSGGSPTAERARARPARQGRLAWWLAQARAQPLAAVGAAIVLGWVVVVFTPLVARVVRSAVLPLVGREFIAAARLRGERGPSIMLRELVPNLLGVLAVEGSIRVGYAIFLIASLGFLGVGVPPPTPDWGVMVSDGQNYATQAPWLVIFPALAISSLVIGINLLSDGVKQLVTALEQRRGDVAPVKGDRVAEGPAAVDLEQSAP